MFNLVLAVLKSVAVKALVKAAKKLDKDTVHVNKMDLVPVMQKKLDEITDKVLKSPKNPVDLDTIEDVRDIVKDELEDVFSRFE